MTTKSINTIMCVELVPNFISISERLPINSNWHHITVNLVLLHLMNNEDFPMWQ